MHDLIIKGGTLVDGTGAEARQADVAVDDGRITDVGQVEGGATRTIDADGLLVTPGWVDIHTHYDGQATWDPELAPSSWHGVTTLVMGNCGVGFAPARPDRHDWLIGLMEGVEDIPGTALAEGIEWEWETFPEYLDALERRRWTVDVGTQVPHGAVRAYVMGERGAKNEPATPEDIDAMRAHRARGVARRRARLLHLAHHGSPGHRRRSGAGHLRGGGRALRHRVSPGRGQGGRVRARPHRLGRRTAGRRLARDRLDAPALGLHGAPRLLRAAPGGRRPRPVAQAAGRLARGLRRGGHALPPDRRAPHGAADRPPRHAVPLLGLPRVPELRSRGLSVDELGAALADPEVRRRITSWTPSSPAQAAAMEKAYERTFVLGDPPDYEPGPERSLAGLAAGPRHDPAGGGLRRDGPRQRAGAALSAHPQLRHRRPRPRARNAPAPPRPARPVRRGRPHRDDLRRVDADVHAHALDARPDPGAPPCRSSTW